MERLTRNKIAIYSAGKTWAGHGFRDMRDNHGFNINARWIDIQDILADPNDTFAPEIHNDHEYLGNVWDNGCKQDCLSADMGILFAQPADGEKHSGSLVELGHITAFNKPVYIIGTCASVEPAGHSDRAWKYQSCVYHWPHISDMLEGFKTAVQHYQKNYKSQWLANNRLAMQSKAA